MNRATTGGDRPIDCDVVIVGAGPVGMTLAVLLGQQGHSVVVLERWPDPYPLPRAVHFDHEVGRIFQAAGIGDELASITEPAEIYQWQNADGLTLLRFGRIGPAPSGWPEGSMFSQPDLEALLAQRADTLRTVEIRRGTTATALDQDERGVTIGCDDGTCVRARFAVGCDGANSTVRDLIGVTPHDLGFFYDWLIVDVILDEPRDFDPMNLQICDPERPTTAVSGGPGRRRWEFMRLPHESVEELNDEQRAWELLEPWDVTPANARLERHALYTFNARHVEQWRVGRVLLAGDAAHQMPPFAGQGMCAGIRDAANLWWKLDHVLTGMTTDSVLDTYGDERLPHARKAIEISMSLGRVICVADPAEAAARDTAMAAEVGEEISVAGELRGIDTGLLHPSAPDAGRLFVQGRVGGRAFDDVAGLGWRVLTIDDDPVPVDMETGTWFESLGGRFSTVPADDLTYQRWFSEHDSRWVVQRPDFVLYGGARKADEVAPLLTDLRRDLDR